VSTAYVVELQVFQGPLDLLLHLIEKEELDITLVSLAQVTKQYLDYIEHMPRCSPAEISAFLVVAVKLLWIKSQALLPRPPILDEQDEDDGTDLVRQLQEFRHYKQVSQQLGHWLKAGRRTFGRLASPKLPTPKPAELENATVTALVEAIEQRLQELAAEKGPRPLAVPRRVTVKQKARHIHQLLQSSTAVPFSTLLAESPDREDVVVTLWAVLEMFKRRWLVFEQEELFGSVTIRRRSDDLAAWDRESEWWAELEDLD
jgi:segregation and condensation protein A